MLLNKLKITTVNAVVADGPSLFVLISGQLIWTPNTLLVVGLLYNLINSCWRSTGVKFHAFVKLTLTDCFITSPMEPVNVRPKNWDEGIKLACNSKTPPSSKSFAHNALITPTLLLLWILNGIISLFSLKYFFFISSVVIMTGNSKSMFVFFNISKFNWPTISNNASFNLRTPGSIV